MVQRIIAADMKAVHFRFCPGIIKFSCLPIVPSRNFRSTQAVSMLNLQESMGFMFVSSYDLVFFLLVVL